MLSFDLTFVWTAVNLIILFLFLRKFLFGRVTTFMEARTAKIEADMAQGAQDKAEGERYREEYAALLKDAAAERARTLEASRKKAAAHYDETVAEAKAEAGRIVAAANAEAERERQRLAAQMRDEVARLALAAAGKVMEANMDTRKNRQLVDDMLDGLEAGGSVA